jgi:hypothetical protein
MSKVCNSLITISARIEERYKTLALLNSAIGIGNL